MTSVTQPWLGISRAMQQKGLEPAMWICAPRVQDTIRKTYSHCKIYDSFKINKGESLLSLANPHHPPQEIIRSAKFLQLKDQVMKMMDRQDDACAYRRLEREAVFYSLFNFFYSKVIEKKIGLLVSAEAPHFPAQMVLYGVCEFLGINRIHFLATRVAPIVFMQTDFYGSKVKIHNPSFDKRQLSAIVANHIESFAQKGSWQEPLYIKQRRERDQHRQRPLKHLVGLLKRGKFKQVVYSGMQKLNPTIWKSSVTHRYTIYSRDFLNNGILPNTLQALRIRNNKKRLKEKLLESYNELSVSVNLQEPYVYFPLHYEPERTTNPDGGWFYNTYDALIALRDLVPDTIPIYVKEHSSQFSVTLPGHRGRSPYFYRSILSLPNVKLVKMEHASFELMDNAQVTAAITGTACFEAACMGKRAIVFGSPWFAGCPNIHQFSELGSYEALLDAPTHDSAEIKAFFDGLIASYAIRGCINSMVDTYFRDKFDNADELLDYEVMASDVLAGLKSLGLVE